MKAFSRKVLQAIAPVFGVCLSISVLQAAHIPFPPSLSWDAWAQWAVLAAVVHAFTALCMFAAERVFSTAPVQGSEIATRAP